MSLLAMVKQANRPGPPEHSVVFRAAATGAVVVAIAACWSQSELSTAVAAVSIALVVGGNVLSYRRRASPVRFLKLVLALAVVVAFGWFFVTVYATASAGDLTSVEGPLAVLFTLIQVTHAFDVPSRRDLGFSLAGSATLMAVAAAQAVDNTFGLYVVVWAALGLTGLLAMWSSMVGGCRLRPGPWPWPWWACWRWAWRWSPCCPHRTPTTAWSSRRSSPSDLPVDDAAALVGGGANGTEPVHAGTPGGLTRVGGFLGFAGPLDTAIRATLGTQVVFRVRADQPTFWIAETFDQWTGQSLEEATPPKGVPAWREISSGSPFTVPPPVARAWCGCGTPDYQTFYLAVAGPNLVFHAANATEVWFPAHRIFVGHRRAPSARAPRWARGRSTPSCRTGQRATPSRAGGAPRPPGGMSRPDVHPRPHGRRWTSCTQSLQLPHPYPRVAALAAAHHRPRQHTTYDKVVALEDWIGAHTHYTTDIPPLAPGQDTVERVPLRQPARLLRTDQHGAGRHAPHPAHPRPRGHRLRARALQPHHRPLRRPGQRRPRLGPGLVPRLRLAELRPDRRGPVGQPDARPRPRPTTWSAPSTGCRWSRSPRWWSAGADRRGAAPAPAHPGHLGRAISRELSGPPAGPGSRWSGAPRWPGWPPAWTLAGPPARPGHTQRHRAGPAGRRGRLRRGRA